MNNNNIEEDYCSFKVSGLLKEKGYRVKTIYYFLSISGRHSKYKNVSSKHFLGADWNSYPSEERSSRVSCPTHALAIKWIEENFGLVVESNYYPLNPGFYSWTIYRKVILKGKENMWVAEEIDVFDTRKDCTEEALIYTLENLIK